MGAALVEMDVKVAVAPSCFASALATSRGSRRAPGGAGGEVLRPTAALRHAPERDGIEDGVAPSARRLRDERLGGRHLVGEEGEVDGQVEDGARLRRQGEEEYGLSLSSNATRGGGHVIKAPYGRTTLDVAMGGLRTGHVRPPVLIVALVALRDHVRLVDPRDPPELSEVRDRERDLDAGERVPPGTRATRRSRRGAPRCRRLRRR